jgi:hypothetical protein
MLPKPFNRWHLSALQKVNSLNLAYTYRNKGVSTAGKFIVLKLCGNNNWQKERRDGWWKGWMKKRRMTAQMGMATYAICVIVVNVTQYTIGMSLALSTLSCRGSRNPT